MTALLQFGWLLPAMAALTCLSGFFSGSEAALFYLRRQDRRAFRTGNPAQRVAAGLLEHPARLLTAILFYNLVVNIAYFALASIVTIRIESQGHTTEAAGFAVASLLVLIFFSEMLPKTLAMVWTRGVAALVSIPLTAAIRALDPLLPALRWFDLTSRRVIWPNFQPEPYLEVGDLERAIRLSTSDAALMHQEQTVLNHIVGLSDIRADELMRPRTQFLSFQPPVALADLEGRVPPSGYVLVTEADSDDVAGAIPLKYLSDIPREHLEHHTEAVVIVPWCATVARALEVMRHRDRKVAAVVNEYGETIGILTYDDILATIFTQSPSRSARLFRKSSIREAESGVWHVTGMTSLRRLSRYFNVRLPATRNVTVAGVMQGVLQRLPERGDRCTWGPFDMTVLDVPERGLLLVEIRRAASVEVL